jgi:hypothetical protein
VAVDLLGAVKGPQLQVTSAAFKRIEGGSTFGLGHQKSVLHFIGGDDFIAAVADRQQIFEFEPEKIIPAVALDIVVFVRVVAAGAFIRIMRIAVDIRVAITEVTHRKDGV